MSKNVPASVKLRTVTVISFWNIVAIAARMENRPKATYNPIVHRHTYGSNARNRFVRNPAFIRAAAIMHQLRRTLFFLPSPRCEIVSIPGWYVLVEKVSVHQRDARVHAHAQESISVSLRNQMCLGNLACVHAGSRSVQPASRARFTEAILTLAATAYTYSFNVKQKKKKKNIEKRNFRSSWNYFLMDFQFFQNCIIIIIVVVVVVVIRGALLNYSWRYFIYCFIAI